MATLIVGNDNANTLSGTSGDDVIYGFNPNGPQKTVTSIDATRVAIGLNQPLFAGAPEGDTGRLSWRRRLPILLRKYPRPEKVDCSGSPSIRTSPRTAGSMSI